MYKKIRKTFDVTKIKRIDYRNDINGLRAIAVLVVLIYHSELKILKAGYLGVDIFFVISGYLITNIIISELNSDTFTFSEFYKRRINRILPALFSTLFFTSIASYLFLTPKTLIEYINSLIPSTFFYSNIYFANLDFYNSEPARYMPLIHTWSLAIEEQFYILFPLFVYFLFKYFKKYLLQVLLISIFISIYLNTSSDSLSKFYLIEFRIWELLAGSGCMFFEKNLKKNSVFSYAGFILMIFPIFYFDDAWIIDIEPKLLSILGVTLVLVFNSKKSTLTKFLSFNLIQKIGLWSFSIYLIHQPVFVFYRLASEKSLSISWKNIENQKTLDDYLYVLLIIIFIIFLSKLNYNFVESKFYTLSNNSKVFILLLSVFSFVFYFYTVNLTKGFEDRWNNNLITQKAINYQKKDNYDLKVNGELCHINSNQAAVKEFCKINIDKSGTPIVVLGDSMSRTIITALSARLKENPITFITGDSCIFLINLVNERCARSDKEFATDYMSEIEDSIVIYIADLWQKVEDDPNELESIKLLNLKNTFPKTINYLSKNNQVILLTQIPTYRPNVPQLILEGKEIVKIRYDEWVNLEGVKILEDIYLSLNKKNLHLVRVDEIFCDSFEPEYCLANTKNELFYSDPKHLSIEGAELVVFEIEKVIKNIENNK